MLDIVIDGTKVLVDRLSVAGVTDWLLLAVTVGASVVVVRDAVVGTTPVPTTGANLVVISDAVFGVTL